MAGRIPALRIDNEGEIRLDEILSVNGNAGFIHESQIPELTKRLQALLPEEAKPQLAPEALRLTPEERAERRARIGQALGTLMEHADEIKGLLSLFGVIPR